MMHVTIELPDELAQRLQAKWQETLAHIALRHAVATDDAELVADLAAAGVRFDAPLQRQAAFSYSSWRCHHWYGELCG